MSGGGSNSFARNENFIKLVERGVYFKEKFMGVAFRVKYHMRRLAKSSIRICCYTIFVKDDSVVCGIELVFEECKTVADLFIFYEKSDRRKELVVEEETQE